MQNGALGSFLSRRKPLSAPAKKLDRPEANRPKSSFDAPRGSRITGSERKGEPAVAKVVLISMFDEWCFGLRSLQAQLKAAGHSVSLVMLRGIEDQNVSSGSPGEGGYHCMPASISAAESALLVDFLRRENPLLVGVTVFSNYTGSAAYIVEEARRHGLGVKFVFGGVEPTIRPRAAAQVADFVCVGEGEDFIVELVEALENDRDPTGIESLAFLKDGQLVRNPVRPYIADLDRLAPRDYERGDKFLIREDRIVPDALPPTSVLRERFTTMTGRGCPFRCTYCCNSVLAGIQTGPYLRRHSVARVIDELRAAKRRQPGIRAIEFHDDVFTIQPKWIEEFADQYKRHIGLPFLCYTYPTLADPDMLAMLKEAGLWTLWMGVQSGSERTLAQVYGRKGTQEEVIEAAKTIEALEIELIIDLIGTSSLETEDDKRATVDLLTRLPPTFRLNPFGPLSFYEDYPILEKAAEAGVELELQPGRATYMCPETPADRFWNSLANMCQFHDLGREFILRLTRVPQLRDDVEAVEELNRALEEAEFWRGGRWRKQFVIDDLREQIEQLKARMRPVEGSRAYRLWRAWKAVSARTADGARRPESSAAQRSEISEPEEPFARGMLALSRQYGMDPGVARRMARIPQLRDDPEFLPTLEKAFHNAALDRLTNRPKDHVISELQGQIAEISRRLANIEGSRLYGLWRKVRAVRERLGLLPGADNAGAAGEADP
jgi:anaerobic magnesium-protoporphyrin IX monomethyl ester cyclase